MRAALPLLALALAGCLGQPSPGPSAPALDHDAIAAAIGAPIVVEHDHRDPALHRGSHNLRYVAWSALGVELGRNGFANFVVHEADGERLAFVAVDGHTDGGFVIADVRSAANIVPLGRYTLPGSGIQEVRVTPDGAWAIVNVQRTPTPQVLLGAGLQGCSVCLHVVDVRDRAAPRFVSALPVDLVGSHNMEVEAYGGDLYVFYTGQPVGSAPPGNYVGIARLLVEPTGARLVKVGEFRHPTAPLDGAQSFPHDVVVEEHPLTGQRIAYVSHWDGGALTFDVSDPLAPRPLGRNAEAAPSDALAIHWFAPEPRPRADGRLVAWSAPEIGALQSGTGVVRSYDLSDPSDFPQLGTWTLPGNAYIPGQFLLSPHITIPDMERGLLAVSHYHAGVWVLDIRDPAQPRALAYAMPHGDPAQPYEGPIWWKKPNFDPDGYYPNVYQARWLGEQLWVTERGTGLYVYAYEGPVPGAV